MTLPTEGSLMGVGNPLLDIAAHVTPELLAKYGLKANDAILADERHAPALFDDLVKNFTVEYVAGGATQNAIRGAQWMLPANATVYTGCVGADEYANSLKKAAEADGVRVEYMTDASTPTGTCAVCITNKDRSLVANLGAANNFSSAHLDTARVASAMNEARFFYIEGYFLTHGIESILKIARHAASKNKTFCMNISAPFLPHAFKAQMEQCLPFVDVLFGNESEAAAFSEAFGLGTTDVAEIALKIAALPKETPRPRLVVITQGSDETIVATNGKTEKFAVIKCKPEEIVDSNGAGDAFCGGFFAGLVQGKPIDQCVKAGHYVANVVIRRSGPTYPREKPTFVFE